MKDQILKIAKVKSEKEFYKKYPTEEAFMAKHGKALKKAAMGKAMVYDQLHQLSDFGNPPIADAGVTTPPEFKFTKFGATSDNPGGSFESGAGQVGMAAIQSLGKIVGGINAIGEQKKNIKKADQAAQLSGLALQANQTMEQPKRNYVREEDNPIQPGQLGNPYGSGTNYLAENGTMIGGNPTEIQNTYAPNDIYNDLGFEPLQETYKQFRHGGHMHKAEFGEYFQDSGQAQIGSAVGGAVGSAFGPAGAVVGQFLGKAAGNLLGGAKDARALQAQKDKMALSQSQLGFQQSRSQGPLNAYMKDGGWVSHDWQPQVIATFGEHKLKDLLQPPNDADMLRAGGHLKEYTPPSEAAMFTGRPDMPMAQDGVQMAMGGELQVGDGGYLETMSYNPNLPGGEIGMFRGASHDNGGIQTKYGENEVEVEGGEPAVKLKDGGSSDNLVVFGNMKINKNIANLMGDPKAKGMKFKTYVADIAKNDAKQLKKISKGLDLIKNSDENNAFDHLSLNTGGLMVKGAQAWQKINADKIKEAGIVQDAIHQTAKHLGVKNDKLAEGKFEKETDPSMVAQDGTTLKSFLKTPFAERKRLAKDLGYADYSGKDIAQQEKLYNLFKSKSSNKPVSLENDLAPHNLIIPQDDIFNVTVEGTRKKDTFHPPSIEDMPGDFFSPKKGSKVLNALKKTGKFLGDYAPAVLSNLEPFIRPSNANEPLPPDQIYPELYSLATNQLQPVQAQTFQPMLDSPVDISFNDQLAAVDSQSRAAIRAAGANPAAQAMIMAQTLQAKNQLLGERDRMNTANRMQVYDKNRALLNDAKLRNLQILDKQYERQTEAASNTAERNFSALSSIAAKTAQQRAVNRKMAVMENLYNFRFDPRGRAINANAPQFFNVLGSGRGTSTNQSGITTDASGNTLFPVWDPKTGKVKGYSVAQSDKAAPSMGEIDDLSLRNGGKASKKNARNSSIVKALKNL
jgi:hypothetical protein